MLINFKLKKEIRFDRSFRPSMILTFFISLSFIPGLLYAESGSVYYPGRPGEWETRRPEDVRMDADALQKVVNLAMANEFGGPRDLRKAILNSF